DVTADRHHAALQGWRRGARIAIGRDEHIRRADWSSRRLKPPLLTLPLDLLNDRAGRETRARPLCGARQAPGVLGRIQARASLVDEQPVISRASELGGLRRRRNQIDAMTEEVSQQLLLLAKRLEV